jgi:hypothetical protein
MDFATDAFAIGFTGLAPVALPDFAGPFTKRTAEIAVAPERCAGFCFFEDIRGRRRWSIRPKEVVGSGSKQQSGVSSIITTFKRHFAGNTPNGVIRVAADLLI